MFDMGHGVPLLCLHCALGFLGILQKILGGGFASKQEENSVLKYGDIGGGVTLCPVLAMV